MDLEKMKIEIEAQVNKAKEGLGEVREGLKEVRKEHERTSKQTKRAIIDTALGKGIAESIAKTKALNAELKELGRAARIEAGLLKPTEEYKQLQQQIDLAGAAIDRMKDKQSGLNPFSSKMTDEYAQLKAENDSLLQSFEKLRSEEDALKDLGLPDSDPQLIKLRNEIEAVDDKLIEYETKMAELNDSGRAFLPNEKWQKLQTEIEKAAKDLDEYKAKSDSLEASGSAYKGPSIREMASGFGSAVKSAYGTAAGKFEAVSSGLGKLISQTPLLNKFTGQIRRSGSALKDMKRGLMMGAGLRQLMRLGGLGAIVWSAVRGIKAGFANLIQYGSSAQSSVESLKSSLLTLKNALATAFAPILSAVAPMLATLIDWCTAAATALAHLMAALTGKSTVVVARKTSSVASGIAGTGKAADSAKKSVEKYKRSLMGFDQINKLDDPDSGSGSGSSGGGGGGAGGVGGMFETVEVGKGYESLAERIKEAWAKADFTEIGEMIGEKLNAALEKIPWDEIKKTAEKIAKSIATLLNGFINKTNWELVGKTFAEGLNTIFTAGYTFVTTFDWKKFGTAIGNSINGFFKNLDLATAAKSLSGKIKGVLESIAAALETVDWEMIGNKIGEFLVNIDWLGIAKSVWTVFKNALIASLNILNGLLDAIVKAGAQKLQDLLASIGIHVDLVGQLERVDQTQLDPKQKILKGSTAEVSKATTSGMAAKDKVLTGFSAGVTKAVNQIATSAKTIGGFTANFTNRKIGFSTTVSMTANIAAAKVSSAAKSVLSNIKIGKKAGGGVYSNGSWKPVTAAAGGGAFNMGQMFIAREAGPELVGTIGRHTAVMNNDQIVGSVSDGVYKAVLAAMAQGGGSGQPVIITLEGDSAKFFKAIQKEAKNYTNATGMSPFPV